MTSKEALRELCETCECHLLLSNKRCPFRCISNDFCDEYEKIKKDLEVLETLRMLEQ